MRTLQAERRIMPKRIRVEVLPNPHYRKYHVTSQVSSEEVHAGMLGGSRHNPFKQFAFSEEKIEFNEDTKATVMRMYDIDGINAVGLKTYEITVEIAPAYEWDEIEGEIISAIKQIVGWSDDETTVDYLFSGRVYAEPVTREVYEQEMDRQRAETERYEKRYGL